MFTEYIKYILKYAYFGVKVPRNLKVREILLESTLKDVVDIQVPNFKSRVRVCRQKFC